MSFVTTDEFSVRITEIASSVSPTHSLPFCFELFLTQWPILSKGYKPDNFESQNSLKRSFTNILALWSNFVECERFLESKSTDILALSETNLDDTIGSCSFSVKGYFSLIRKDSILLICMVLQFMWRKTSICMELISRKLCGFLLIFLTGFTSPKVLLYFPLSVTFIFMHNCSFCFIWDLIIFHL